MTAREIEQVAVHVTALDEFVALMQEALGISFGTTATGAVAGKELRVASSSIGLTLVEVSSPAEEGLRAVGLKVENLEEIRKTFESAGHQPSLVIERGMYRELQYRLAGLTFSLAEYPDQPIPRLNAAAEAGIMELDKHE